MPYRITFVPECGVIVVRLTGELTPAEVQAGMNEIPSQSWFRPHIKLIIDARGCTTEMKGADIERLAAHAKGLDPVWGQSKWAVLAPADLFYGLSRMYMALTANCQVQTNVFRSIEEASDWLGGGIDVEEALKRAG